MHYIFSTTRKIVLYFDKFVNSFGEKSVANNRNAAHSGRLKILRKILAVVFEGDAVGVGIDLSAQDQYSLDKAPYRADTASHTGHNDLYYPAGGVAKVEIMHADASEQNPENSGEEP